MCHAKNQKRQTTHDLGNRLPNQENIRILGEKETHKYMGTLKAHKIKQLKMKEKN